MKKKILIAVFIFGITAGYFIGTYSKFNEEKREAFSLAQKVCEKNIGIAEKLKGFMEELEGYEKKGFVGVSSLTNDFISRVVVFEKEIKKGYETNGKYMEDILKDYMKISEAGVTIAVDSYLQCAENLIEAYIVSGENMTEREQKSYNEYMSDAKKELEYAKDFFETYLEKLKNKKQVIRRLPAFY